MRTALIFAILVSLVGAWYIFRPQGRTWADCDTAKGIICVPKAPLKE